MFYSESKAYFVVCSIDAQNKLDDLFTKNLNFNKIELPIMVDNSQCFTIRRYRSNTRSSSMMLISSNGAQIIRDICIGCNNTAQMLARLKLYFSKIVNDHSLDYSIAATLPYIIKHFDMTKDQLNSPYKNTNDNKCICIYFPILLSESRGLSVVISQLKKTEKEIINGRLNSY